MEAPMKRGFTPGFDRRRVRRALIGFVALFFGLLGLAPAVAGSYPVPSCLVLPPTLGWLACSPAAAPRQRRPGRPWRAPVRTTNDPMPAILTIRNARSVRGWLPTLRGTGQRATL